MKKSYRITLAWATLALASVGAQSAFAQEVELSPEQQQFFVDKQAVLQKKIDEMPPEKRAIYQEMMQNAMETKKITITPELVREFGPKGALSAKSERIMLDVNGNVMDNNSNVSSSMNARSVPQSSGRRYTDSTMAASAPTPMMGEVDSSDNWEVEQEQRQAHATSRKTQGVIYNNDLNMNNMSNNTNTGNYRDGNVPLRSEKKPSTNTKKVQMIY